MSLRRLSLAAFFLSVLMVKPSVAHEDDDPQKPKKRTTAPTRDPREYRTDQSWAFEFRVGPYRPRVDDEFNGGATPFADLFGEGQSVAFGIEADWQAFRIPYFGTIGLGVNWHLAQYGADALSAADPTVRIAHPTRMILMPMAAVGVLRVDVLAQNFSIPVVPYIKGGLSTVYWQSSDAGSMSQADGVAAEGLEGGLQFQLGGMLHLNFFAPQASLDMDNSAGVNNAYLFFEWMISDADSFDTGMQMGTSTWMTGVAVEF